MDLDARKLPNSASSNNFANNYGISETRRVISWSKSDASDKIDFDKPTKHFPLRVFQASDHAAREDQPIKVFTPSLFAERSCEHESDDDIFDVHTDSMKSEIKYSQDDCINFANSRNLFPAVNENFLRRKEHNFEMGLILMQELAKDSSFPQVSGGAETRRLI
jgi:hypothetical protein